MRSLVKFITFTKYQQLHTFSNVKSRMTHNASYIYLKEEIEAMTIKYENDLRKVNNKLLFLKNDNDNLKRSNINLRNKLIDMNREQNLKNKNSKF